MKLGLRGSEGENTIKFLDYDFHQFGDEIIEKVEIIEIIEKYNRRSDLLSRIGFEILRHISIIT